MVNKFEIGSLDFHGKMGCIYLPILSLLSYIFIVSTPKGVGNAKVLLEVTEDEFLLQLWNLTSTSVETIEKSTSVLSLFALLIYVMEGIGAWVEISNSDLPQKLDLYTNVSSIKRQSSCKNCDWAQSSICSQEDTGNWQLLGEGEYALFKVIMSGRSTTFQWKDIHPNLYGYHKLYLIGLKIIRKIGKDYTKFYR